MTNPVSVSSAVLIFASALCVLSHSASGAQAPPTPAPSRGVPAPVEAPLPPVLKDYKPVTATRLKNPEPDNWLQIRGTYNGWGYSLLDQITPKNVDQLQLAWVFSTGAVASHEAAPLVNNGVMYVSAPGNQVVAIEAKTGTQLWRYRRELPADMVAMHRVSRGVALHGDKVFFASNAAVLVALDARTGKEVWTSTVEDNKKGYYLTAAPLVADGKVMVGVSGGEFGIRGFVAAYDVDTGKETWRAFTIPAPGEPGHDTWPRRRRMEDGRRRHMGVGQLRSGHESAVLGRRQRRPVDGGSPAWRQSLRLFDDCNRCVHREDCRALSIQPERILRLGRSLAAAAHRLQAQRQDRHRSGQRRAQRVHLFSGTHERARSEFVDANPYVLQTAFKSVDPKTGRVEYDPEHKPGVGKTATSARCISAPRTGSLLRSTPRRG